MHIIPSYTLIVHLGSFQWDKHPGKDSGWFLKQINNILGFEPSGMTNQWLYVKYRPYTDEEKKQLIQYLL